MMEIYRYFLHECFWICLAILWLFMVFLDDIYEYLLLGIFVLNVSWCTHSRISFDGTVDQLMIGQSYWRTHSFKRWPRIESFIRKVYPWNQFLTQSFSIFGCAQCPKPRMHFPSQGSFERLHQGRLPGLFRYDMWTLFFSNLKFTCNFGGIIKPQEDGFYSVCMCV